MADPKPEETPTAAAEEKPAEPAEPAKPELVKSISNVYVFYIDVRPCSKANDVIKGIKDSLYAAKGKDGCNVIWIMKVLGENRIIAVVEKNSEPVIEELNDRVGEHVDVTCTNARPYEHFAHSINGVEAGVCGPPPKKITEGVEGKHVYYVRLMINFKGKEMKDLRDIWPKESEMMLKARAAGQLEMEFWKELMVNAVHVLTTNDPDAADDLSFGIPLNDLGDNLTFYAREVKLM